ncbi:MAG: glucosaminidase domain-containing protein [Alphaproteobacteria bacterium]|nr:glucosaminidase domain-containing protein [Alphaproteobacteria bacterium]
MARHWASLAGVVVVSIMVVGGLAQIPANPSGKDRGVPAAESNASDGRAPAVAAAAGFKPGGVSVVPASAHKLFRNFRKIGYRLEDVRNGAGPVPRVFVKAMPQDIGEVPSVATRKAVFIKTMLPLVLRTNEEIRAIRAKVLALTERKAKGTAVAPADRAWLAAQYDRFGVAMGDRATLLRRVDVVPPSLALAQAAEESGWGSSRFALEGRALFGQRTYRSAPGLVPGKRPEGARFRIKSFDHLLEGVRSYVQNLNTHPAYKRFRTLRAHLRAAGGSGSGFDSLRLVETLHKYSERGAAYIRTIKTIIRVNDLRALDGARLSRAQPVRPDPA